jgi:hypothetical protein
VLLDKLSDGDIVSARVVAEQAIDQILHIRQWLALAADGLEVPLGHFPEVDPGLMKELEQLGRSALNELGPQLDRLSRWPRDGVHPSTQAGACLQQKHRFARLSQAPCRRQPGDSTPDHHHVPGHQQLWIYS